MIAQKDLISNQPWPQSDDSFIKTTNIKIPIQVNGKMRAIIEVPLDLKNDDLKQIAQKEKNVLKFLNGPPKKVIVIPNRVVNFVI